MHSFIQMMNSIDIFKKSLKDATAAQLGQFGEHLLQRILDNQQVKFSKVHKNGVDFFIEGVGNVDLKTRNHIDRKCDNKKIKYKDKLKDVTYYYFYCYSDIIQLFEDGANGFNKIIEITWFECRALLPDFTVSIREELSVAAASQVKSELKKWILQEWGWNARIISRSGRRAQESFENNGWGPNNFYTPEKLRKNFQLVVLIYFDMGAIYKILAYPTGLTDEIDWYLKDKGPNHSGIMIFDPRRLNSKFVFDDLDDFKNNYLDRIF